MAVKMLLGDCRAILPTLAADSFDCIVTSPPYWGLRDYGVAGQIGIEPTLDAYVETMAALGDELWRVLKPGGTFWLNLGDCYAANRSYQVSQSKHQSHDFGKSNAARVPNGLKPKDLCGVPWRVAFALQAHGWWLRSAIVWAKGNPMPESVTDRPTSAYEMVFLLTKAERYYYDDDAISEEFVGVPYVGRQNGAVKNGDRADKGRTIGMTTDRRNARNVWQIATQPYHGAHFATMPPDLAERCIKAGCPVGGHVLDPFAGAGTTGLVADRLGRNATLIELNPAYCTMGENRMRDDAPLFWQAAE